MLKKFKCELFPSYSSVPNEIICKNIIICACLKNIANHKCWRGCTGCLQTSFICYHLHTIYKIYWNHITRYIDWFLFPFLILALIKDWYKHLPTLPSPFIMLFHQHLKVRSFPELLSSMQYFQICKALFLHSYLVSRSLTLDLFSSSNCNWIGRVRLPKVGQAWEQTWELFTSIETACLVVPFVGILFALVENENVACAWARSCHSYTNESL